MVTFTHEVYICLTAENQQEQTRQKRVPQTNVYTIDFVIDGDIRKALDTRDADGLYERYGFIKVGKAPSGSWIMIRPQS